MQLSDMQTLVSQRLNEAGAPVFYPATESANALNEADRLFTLSTLALETTVSWTPAATFTHMLPAFGDWIAPLRITNASGQKVRPCRIRDLWALDANWTLSATPITRYAAMGADLIAVYGQNATTLNVTYAKAPAGMVNPTDAPATPPEYHPIYISYAIWRLRQVEGIEVLKSVIPLLEEFLAGAAEYAAFMRARNIGSGYDTLPPEFALRDRSRSHVMDEAKS
jgi:hypothetical protein